MSRRRFLRAALAPLLLVPALCSLAACGRHEEGFHLLPLVVEKKYAVGDETPEGLSFPRPPELHELEIDHEERPAVLTAMSPWRWRGRIPPGARLNAGVQTLPAAWKVIRGLRASVSVRDGRTREILEVASTTEREEPRWLDLEVDLSRFAGREITLEMAASLDGVPESYRDANLVAWGPVLLSSPPEQAAEDKQAERPPNILFILVDTLRHDHLTPYGYTRHDTTPEIKRQLADPGLVVEDAYSQAPWTLPSVISFMTGRHPGELVGSDLAAFGIPEDVEPLAARMTRLGYHTGGFVGNPTLHAGAGFGRGFRTYYAPPADVQWLLRHADDVNRHAVPWLRAFQRRPFFLYVHYIDPHDPYENPDMIEGRAFFMPGYTGSVAGSWIHGIYNGRLKLPDPERDIPYIEALYDGEIRYVDRHIGALLGALDPDVLKNTLIVLTADHGEELHDHGGWKHGQTLYEEQIHVPLIFRWDGRIKAGTRLAGTVRLLDLLPTLSAAVGGKADPGWDGVDLLPALTGRGELPRRPAFAEGLSGGPLRAAAVLDGRKLILFNREEPFRPADSLQEYLWRVDLDRLGRAELYDLAKDPGERRDLAETDPQGMDRLAPVIHGQLSKELPGLWVLPDIGLDIGPEGLPAGSRLSGSIEFERPLRGWSPYFLGPEDHVELNGTRLRFDLTGAPGGKGLRIEGNFGRIVAVEPARVRLWLHDRSHVVKRQTAINPETEKSLRNLGYIQ